MLQVKTSPKEALEQYFGFRNFKGEQEDIINTLLQGNDAFVIMPTGGGKSLCYQLPALMSEGTAIIVSPLIALMKNQVDAIRGFCENESVAHFLNSSLNKGELTRVREDVTAGKTKMLYVAPESLTKDENIEFLQNIQISFFAIDEAHCISEWGHDFRPEYRRLRPIMEAIGRVPVIALTATATPKVQSDIQKNLGMTKARLFKASFNRSNLYYEVKPKKNIDSEIVRFVKQNEGKSGIIYCLSRKKVEEIAELLNVNGISAVPYHAGLDTNQRARHQDMFLMEEVNVVVATIAFGMGIDKPDVRFVIHYDIPKSLEGYYQETGRAGRDGGEGYCLTFYSYKDIEKLEKFLHGKPLAELEVGRQLLSETVSYAETSMCRRKYLLHYFGEAYDDSKCTNGCDNCRYPKKKFDGKEYATDLLTAVEAFNGKHKAKFFVDLFQGKDSSEIKMYKVSQHELFGSGKDKDEPFWQAVIRQVTVKGFLRKDIETYGLIHLTDLGKAYLENPTDIQLIEERDYTGDNEDIAVVGRSAADEVLFKQLKDIRRKVAKQLNLPPYVIFQDPSLEDMATQYPINLEELTKIQGVGKGKATKFGAEFVDFIARYVKDNNIERPQDMVFKSVVNKSGLKVHIIQNIDRKMPLDEIAKSKNKTFDEIITELENIVHSGTKLNIDYYLDEILDEDSLDEIFEYFMEAESESVEDAIKHFGDDFSEEELRLARIKFLSEVAN
ncbi:MAG: DNA helicase RecQ [Luteibaculaceae bacterium]